MLSILFSLALTLYPIAPAKDNQLTLTVGKTGLMAGKQHRFVFPEVRGQISFDNNSPEQSTVQVSVDANSLTVQDDWVKDKDRFKIREYALGNEMLDVARYPTITFQSQKVERGADGHYRVSGQLTITGKTQPATIDAVVHEVEGRLTVDGSAMLRLSEYQLKRPTAALGSVGTKDEMTLTIHLVSATRTSR